MQHEPEAQCSRSYLCKAGGSPQRIGPCDSGWHKKQVRLRGLELLINTHPRINMLSLPWLPVEMPTLSSFLLSRKAFYSGKVQDIREKKSVFISRPYNIEMCSQIPYLTAGVNHLQPPIFHGLSIQPLCLRLETVKMHFSPMYLFLLLSTTVSVLLVL